MGKRGVEFRVGVFVALSILILILGFLWLSGYRAGKTGYEVTVHFSNVGGLRVGDPVQIAGVEKGKVRKVELRKHLVEVVLWLEKDVALSSDCRILIRDVAMISGTKFVKIEPGYSDIPLDVSKTVTGVSPPDFSISDLQFVVSHLSESLERLSNQLLTEETVRSLKEAIDNTSRLTRELSLFASESRADLTEGMKDLRDASRELKQFVISEEFRATLESLRRISLKLEEVSEGEGSLGKLIKDEELYNELRETTRSARDLLEDIKANPRKYLKISIF